MFSVYRGMNSYPCQRGQMPSTQYCYPGWEAVPPQMKEDPPNSPHVHESWPHSYGYPTPIPCQSCCTHGQFPAYYYFRPPCPHFSPPPSYSHYCGGYPAYPQPNPVNYVPPPQYTMELPRYEYDKNAPNEFHCCGCANHQCNRKNISNVKIEEHDPDVETKKAGGTLASSGVNNFPNPILWIPPGYTANKEQPTRVVDNEANKQQVSPYIKESWVQPRPLQTEVGECHDSTIANRPNQSLQTVEPDSNNRYGWVPLDINSIRQILEGRDVGKTRDQVNKSDEGKRAHDGEKKDQNKQFSYPIIWMPYDGQGQNNLRGQEVIEDVKAPVEEPPSTVKVAPMGLEHPDNQASGRTFVDGHGNGLGTAKTKKSGSLRTIPVKQLEESVHELPKGDVTPTEKAENTKQESIEKRSIRQSSSPSKKSKLPPICLRVDPPKKKNGNTSSRLPSPPGDKKREKSDDSKAGGQKDELHLCKKDIKVNEVADKVPDEKTKIEVSHGADNKRASGAHEHMGEAERKAVLEDPRSGDDRVHAPEAQGVEESRPQEPSKPPRKKMSETEAAVIIQSAYRGYEVRRWEPLKKLRQIAEVRKEATEVQKHIEDLQPRATVDNYEKAVVGESIMKLLLKLDTIQGLHDPGFRDVRRSVAKELTNLQEKLDCIVSQKLGEGSAGSIKSVEAQKEDDGGIFNEAPRSQFLDAQDTIDGPENKEISDTFRVNEEPQSEPHNEAMVSAVGVEDRKGDDPCLGMKEKEIDLNKIVSRSAMMEPLANVKPVEEMVVPIDMRSGTVHQEASLLAELPKQVVEEQIEDEISRMDWECDLGSAKITGSNDHDRECDLGTEKFTANKDEEASLLEESPQEVGEEHVENEISRMDWECDLGAAKITSLDKEPREHQGSASSVDGVDWEHNLLAELPLEVTNGFEEQTSVAENSGTLNKDQEVDQLSENPGLGSEELVAIEHEYHVPVVVSSDKKLSGQEPECTESSTDMDIPAMGQGSHELQEPIGAEPSLVEPGIQEKLVEVPSQEPRNQITEEGQEMSSAESNLMSVFHENPVDNNGEIEFLGGHHERPRKLEPVSLHSIMEESTKSETVKQEVISETEIPETDAQQYKDEDEASTLSSECQGSVAASDNQERVDKKILEENEKLRDMLEKLLASGRQQQDVISSLTERVKDLENKLAKKKTTTRSAKQARVTVSRPPCRKSVNGTIRMRPSGIAS